ncbi:MAG: hypothetical protein IJQ01_07100 [Selenomonadaceae bacterium]|nr:hypothetical protein [Selenomonadaceae bacterium]
METFIARYGLTVILTASMIAWALKAFKTFKAYVAKDPFGDYEQPRTASVLGVLGTFIGIAFGLWNFNPSPEAMHNSVINLLGGMTTAFVTSIIGMGISLVFKNYQANAQKDYSRSHLVKADSTITDLIQYLQQADAQKSELLMKLTNSLVGDGDSTVIGQMKIIQSDIRDEFKGLEKVLQDNNANVIRELKDFGRTLAESNSKAFIEALNETMKDFNQKLTEQFGENFKQLNIAVGRLLVWQENYKATIEELTEDMQATFKGIDAVKNSVAKIEESAASITECSEQILNLIVTANIYERKLQQLLSEIQSISKDTAESIQDLTKDMHGVINNANNMTQRISATTNTALNRITDTTNQTITSMQKMSNELSDESFKITKETVSKMEEMMRKNDENFKESLETLGKAMLQISKKFAEDYTPLAERLKAIVEIAEQVRPSQRGGLF